MTALGVAAIFGLVLCWLAFRANVRFRDENRLPMQWWLNGEVTWSAPRVLALAFIPALAMCVLSIDVVMTRTTMPRAGQEAEALPALLALGATFVAIQLGHFRLIAMTLRHNGN